MCPFTCENDSEARPPGAGSDDGDAAHGRCAPPVPDSVGSLVLNLDSVPAARRPMFWRCLQITSTETKAINPSCRESTYSCSAQASRGKAAATATEPSET